MYYMQPSKFEGGGDNRQNQQQTLPEQPRQARNDAMNESNGTVAPPQSWDAAFRRNEIHRLVSLPSSSTSDSAPDSPYPKRDPSVYMSSIHFPPSLDVSNTSHTDSSNVSLYRSYIPNSNNQFIGTNAVQNYVHYNHQNVEAGRFPSRSEYEPFPSQKMIRYSNSNIIPSMHSSVIDSPNTHRNSRIRWMDPQTSLHQQQRSRIISTVPFQVYNESTNDSPSVMPKSEASATSAQPRISAGLGSTMISNIRAEALSDIRDTYTQPLEISMKKPSYLQGSSQSSKEKISIPISNFSNVTTGVTSDPIRNQLKSPSFLQLKEQSIVKNYPVFDDGTHNTSNPILDQAPQTNFREDAITSENSFEETVQDESSKSIDCSSTTIPSVYQHDINNIIKHEEDANKKLQSQEEAKGCPTLSTSVFLQKNDNAENTFGDVKVLKTKLHLNTPSSRSDDSFSTDGSICDKHPTNVTTPRKFDFSTCDFNESCEAAKILQFMQVHSPSMESVADVTRMNIEYAEQLKASVETPHGSSTESKKEVISKVEKAQSYSRVEESPAKTNRRSKTGKRSKDDNETGKSTSTANVQGLTSQLPLPDLRNEIPPWHKLVKTNSKVARMEDRDELFLSDGEEQNDIVERSKMLKDSDFIAKARASIDPSFDALFVAMAQMIPCELNADDQNSAITSYKNHEIGFAGLCCRHCGGRPGSGRYFPNSVRSLSQTTTALNMIKHFVNASNVVPDEVTNIDTSSAGSSSPTPNELEGNSRLEFTKKGKVQRIGGKHCTHCPYSVWVWLTEFQRRQSGVKTTVSAEGSSSNQECKIEPNSDVPNQQDGGGQRVRYGARKIFYSRVWKRMNKAIEQRKGPREDRNDTNFYPSSENDDTSESEESSKSTSFSPFINENIAETMGNKKISKRKRHSQPLPMVSAKLGKRSKLCKTRNKNMMKTPTTISNTKNDISFLDLTLAEKAVDSDSSDGTTSLEHQSKQKRSLEWEV